MRLDDIIGDYPWISKSVMRLDYIIGDHPGMGRIFVSSLKLSHRLWGPRNLLFSEYRVPSGRSVKMTIHLHLVPRVRKCGTITPLPYAFMESTGNNLPSHFTV